MADKKSSKFYLKQRKRKIIQISTIHDPDGVICLYALCDDGTVWEVHDTSNKSESQWILLQNVPQPTGDK